MSKKRAEKYVDPAIESLVEIMNLKAPLRETLSDDRTNAFYDVPVFVELEKKKNGRKQVMELRKYRSQKEAK